MVHRLAGPVVAVLLLAGLGIAGCSTTRYYERQKLADRAMAFDADRQVLYLRDKIEAAREGGLGGYGGAAAGGCGCE